MPGEYYIIYDQKNSSGAYICQGAYSWSDAQSCPGINKCNQTPPVLRVESPKFEGLPLTGRESHPNFWSQSGIDEVGKWYYKTGGLDANYTHVYWWSKNLTDFPGQREIVFQPYLNDVAQSPWEWERWDDVGGKAVVYQYAGPDPAKSKVRYLNNKACLAGQQGFAWPDHGINIFAFTTEAGHYRDGSCGQEWVSSRNPGAFTASYLAELWGDAYSSQRELECDEWFSHLPFSTTRNLCVQAPQVGLVLQRYQGSPDADEYITGCEITVYSWGYPESSDNNYRNWMRNGELMWTRYAQVPVQTNNQGAHPANHALWNQQCMSAYYSEDVAKQYYTGEYVLNGETYVDNADLNPSAPNPDVHPEAGDGDVDWLDWNVIKQAFATAVSAFDLVADGVVNILDLNKVYQAMMGVGSSTPAEPPTNTPPPPTNTPTPTPPSYVTTSIPDGLQWERADLWRSVNLSLDPYNLTSNPDAYVLVDARDEAGRWYEVYALGSNQKTRTNPDFGTGSANDIWG